MHANLFSYKVYLGVELEKTCQPGSKCESPDRESQSPPNAKSPSQNKPSKQSGRQLSERTELFFDDGSPIIKGEENGKFIIYT